jgi:hypothetical protein
MDNSEKMVGKNRKQTESFMFIIFNLCGVNERDKDSAGLFVGRNLKNATSKE